MYCPRALWERHLSGLATLDWIPMVDDPKQRLVDLSVELAHPAGSTRMGVDPATSVGIMKLLDRINRTGTTVVMATHDHAIVDAMQRRVVQLADGNVIRDEVSGRYETVGGEA